MTQRKRHQMNFYENPNFLLPFLSTLGASLTIIILGFFARLRTEKRQKLLTINYIMDMSYRTLLETAILKKHTVKPHIIAIEKILNGDIKLLAELFKMDDFHILTEKPEVHSYLPNEYLLQVGTDNLKLMQLYNHLLVLKKEYTASDNLNVIVSNHLNDWMKFNDESDSDKTKILDMYGRKLHKVEDSLDRLMWFVLYLIVPEVKIYTDSIISMPYMKNDIRKKLNDINKITEDYSDMIPPSNLMKEIKYSGIQSKL